MWVLVLFDLPVSTKTERRKALYFRNVLLDLGFEMVQYSVYIKHCAGKEQAEGVQNKVSLAVPEHGNVKLIFITDKQFGNIVHLGSHKKQRVVSEQLALF